MSERDEADGGTPSGGNPHRNPVVGGHDPLLDDDRARIGPIISIVAITIDFCAIAAARIEEIERNVEMALLLVADGAQEPVGRTALLAGDHRKIAHLAGKHARVIPVDGDILDELEGLRVRRIILGQVGGHLNGRIDHDIECELLRQRRKDLRIVLAL